MTLKQHERLMNRYSRWLIATIIIYFIALAAGVIVDRPQATYAYATVVFFLVMFFISRARRRATDRYIDAFRRTLDEIKQQHEKRI